MVEDHMLWVPDEVVYAVGRVTIAAGELELVLAMIGASQTTDGNAFVILAKPGEPLRAARRTADSMRSLYREAFLPVIEQAAELLAKRHAVIHAMWVNDAPDQAVANWQLLHYKTHLRNPADPNTLDGIAHQLMEIRNHLVHILTAQINNQVPSLE
jgi:hypothetical protein